MYDFFNASIQSNWEANSFQIVWSVDSGKRYRWAALVNDLTPGEVLEWSKFAIEHQCSTPLTKTDVVKLSSAVDWALSKIQQ